jgi:hypothetical protein
MIDSISGNGLLAIQRGQQTATTAADKVARAGTTAEPDTDRALTEGSVEMLQAKQQLAAGAEVLSRADEMLGTLLDEQA